MTVQRRTYGATGNNVSNDSNSVTGNNDDIHGNGATGHNVGEVNGDGMTDNNVDDDCDGAMEDDVRHNGQQRRQDINGNCATGNNNNNDGDLGLGARLPPPSSLPTPHQVGG